MRRRSLTSILALALAATAGCKQAAETPAKTVPAEQAAEKTKKPAETAAKKTKKPAAPALKAAAEGWTRLDAAKLSEDMQARLGDAKKAQKGLATSLMKTLKAAVGKGEWAKGIEACKQASPAVSAQVAKNHDVKVGRTSFKVRNPDNAPSGWRVPVVESKEDKMALFEGPEGQLGYMAPIHMVLVCTTCHGSDEQIPADVKKMLAQAYPEDKATGFAPNDLRGWFWVEVAKR